MKIMKKIVAGICAVSIIISQNSITIWGEEFLKVDAEETIKKSEADEILLDIKNKMNIDLSIGIKEKVDLSNSVYFPQKKINQGDKGACGCCATVYYQYSYEANRRRGITSVKEAKTYSPYYAYLAGSGRYNTDIMSFLKERGGIENEDTIEYSEELIKNVESMRNALTMRVNDFYEYWVDYKIDEDYSWDEKLKVAKTLLSNGIMLSSNYNAYRGDYISLDNGVEVYYRMGDGYDGYHASVIVGYDDNVAIDVNGNGIYEKEEKGAFKIVNSWGEKSNGGYGYFWVLYDAVVNEVSDIKSDAPKLEVEQDRIVDLDVSNKLGLVYSNGKFVELTSKNFLEKIIELDAIPIYNDETSWWQFRNKIYLVFKDYLTSEQKDRLDDWYNNNCRVWKDKLEQFKDENNNKLPSNWDEVYKQWNGMRTRYFSRGLRENDSHNWYCFFSVEPKTVDVIAQLDSKVNVENKSEIKIKNLNSKIEYKAQSPVQDTESMLTTEKEIINTGNGNKEYTSVSGTTVYDITNLTNNRQYILGKQIWTIQIDNVKNVGNYPAEYKFSLTDDLGKKLTFNESNSETYVKSDSSNITLKIETNLQLGDLDYDGVITDYDIELLRYYLMGDKSLSNVQQILADINSDGKVNVYDVRELLVIIYEKIMAKDTSFVKITKNEFYNILSDFGYRLGDINCDSKVDVKDMEIMQQIIYGDEYPDYNMIYADIDKNGVVDAKDLKLLATTICYRDIDGDNKYTQSDIFLVHDYLRGYDLDESQMKKADINADGKVNQDDFWLLLYGYYMNTDINKDLSSEEFYGDLLISLSMSVGNFDSNINIDEKDLEIFKKTVNHEYTAYRNLILADVNKDFIVNEEDIKVYEEKFMSDIPFTYEINKSEKTIKITGLKNLESEIVYIKPEYCINQEKYKVTEIGGAAFQNCKNLSAAYIPASIIKINASNSNEAPFKGVDSDAFKLYCEVKAAPKEYGNYWSYNVDNIEMGYEVKDINEYYNYTADRQNKTITITGGKPEKYHYSTGEAKLDDFYLCNGEIYTVESIADNAFKGDNKLVIIEFPATIRSIGNSAFADCPFVDEIRLERCHNLKSIGKNMIANCKRMSSLVIPESVESIEVTKPEESICWNVSDMFLLVFKNASIVEKWGIYWNAIDEDTFAETIYTKDYKQ